MPASGEEDGRKILIYGDQRLRRSCRRVDPAENDLPGLIAEMRRLMRRNRGVGLAAPQVGDDRRVVVIDPPGRGRGSGMVLLNPEIVDVSQDTAPFEEGCLSFPDIYRRVDRPRAVVLRWTDPDGSERTAADDGILARIAQHEVDHLDGVLFIDHLSPWERFRVRARTSLPGFRSRGEDFR